MNTDEPLIWTSQGNLPEASLSYEKAWDVQKSYIKFTERYRLQDGTVVKESAHVYVLEGLQMQGSAASFG